MAWVTQGPIAKRELEKLGWTDRGVILLRKILARELDNIERGEDPMGVIRDPHKIIELPSSTAKTCSATALQASSAAFNRAITRTQKNYSNSSPPQTRENWLLLLRHPERSRGTATQRR